MPVKEVFFRALLILAVFIVTFALASPIIVDMVGVAKKVMI
jgi:hypothetical protein